MRETINTIILSVALVLAVIFYCYSTRYQVSGTGTGVPAYLCDRMTGQCWLLAGKNKHPVFP